MNSNIFQWRSIKTRVTLFTLAIFVISIWLLAAYASQMLREDMQRLLADQQFSTVSLIAADINQELDYRQKALEAVAISPVTLGDTQALQAFLESQRNLQILFNGGVVVSGPDGTAIADVPRLSGRVGTNYMDSDHLIDALKHDKAAIGRPVMGPKVKAPIFVMTVPIHDAQGKVIGALSGVVNLGMPNFLDKITEARQGKTGGYLLVAPQYRLVVTATDKSRIMETLPAPGANPVIDRFIQGYEGSDIAVSPLGIEALASAKGVPVAGWYLAVVLPTAEAFAPIRAMQRRMLLAALILTLLAGGLTWWMLRRQLSSMITAARTLGTMSEANQPLQPLPVARNDEIGELIGGFNHLLETLKQREGLLRQILDTSSVAIFLVDAEGRITQANQRMADMFGCSLEALIGNEYVALVHPAERESGRQKMFALLAGAVPSVDLDRLYWRADQSEFWGHLTCKRFHDASGEERGLIGVIADISERKQVEQGLRESDERNRALLGVSPDGIWIHNKGTIAYVNDALVTMLGYGSAQDLVGRSIEEFFVPEFREALRQRVAKVVTTLGRAPLTESAMLRRDAARLDVETTAAAFVQEDVVWSVSIIRDITQRKQADAELRIAATAFESREGLMVTDANSVILRVNRAFTEITGYTAEEALGQTPKLLQSGRHGKDFYREMWEGISRTGGWEGEVWGRRKSGKLYPKWLNISAVKNDKGMVTNYVGRHVDITERKEAEKRIEELAFFDQLTGLPNRTLLLDRLKQAMTAGSRSGQYGALLFIDLDNFKTLNDTLGHDMGDLLLKQVAERLATCVRAGDSVARLGGDEFVVMLAGLSASESEAANQTEAVGEKILATFNQAYQLGHVAFRSTASVGVTLFRGNLVTIDDLMKQADLAMYKSKDAGRNTLRFYDPAMEVAVMARAALEADLREAVQERQFLLHYQAQVVGAGRITGAEVLVRWRHPERGLVPPAEFIPTAEETGLILPLGNWVLETVCRQLVAWAARPDFAHLTVAVNVSAHQFLQRDFVDQVLAVLDHTGANPQRLKLELTESLLVANVEDIIDKMFALKARGVGFSLDDFGTGYSSLSYLKRLPLDQLKIDQSFVRDVLSDPNDAAIAKTVIALAQSLGLGVMAEGVETAAQRDFLAGSGCHAYQGYFFAKPLPLEDFEAFALRV